MKKFNSVKELIEAKAQQEVNNQTISCKDKIELAKMDLLFVGEDFTKFVGINENCDCQYIRSFGYAIAS